MSCNVRTNLQNDNSFLEFFPKLLEEANKLSFRTYVQEDLPQNYAKASEIAAKMLAILQETFKQVACKEDCVFFKEKCTEMLLSPLFRAVIHFEDIKDPLKEKCRDSYEKLEKIVATRDDAEISRLQYSICRKLISYGPSPYEDLNKLE